jgi:hypothetical protein
MTLLIACLLIYNFNLSGWWYLVAAILWLARTALIYSAFADLDRVRR